MPPWRHLEFRSQRLVGKSWQRIHVEPRRCAFPASGHASTHSGTALEPKVSCSSQHRPWLLSGAILSLSSFLSSSCPTSVVRGAAFSRVPLHHLVGLHQHCLFWKSARVVRIGIQRTTNMGLVLQASMLPSSHARTSGMSNVASAHLSGRPVCSNQVPAPESDRLVRYAMSPARPGCYDTLEIVVRFRNGTLRRAMCD